MVLRLTSSGYKLRGCPGSIPGWVLKKEKKHTSYICIIREYGSTPYVGMTRFFSFSPYIGIGAKSRNRPKIDKTRLCIAKYTIYIL